MAPEQQPRLRILLLGAGGREHAIAWKLSQSPLVDVIYCFPGNGGTAREDGKVVNVTLDGVKSDDYAQLVVFAKNQGINLVVPGPEQPLVDGATDIFTNAGIKCFGPSKSAARMEGSKTFSKDFMSRHNIPTAAYGNFDNYDRAVAHLDSLPASTAVVLKASGIAAGKGVIMPETRKEAHEALKTIMLNKEFGSAGDEVVIEEYLEGDELSILAFSDGYTIRALPPAQDHKRIFDGDKGPNTGGMGCYCPTRIASKEVLDTIHKTILQPTIDGMRKERMPFVGMLFTGLMMTKDGPKVLEYNVRFGDPETEVVLPLLGKQTDLAEIFLSCVEHWLDAVTITIEPKFGATVILASEGYPGTYPKGKDISFASTADGKNRCVTFLTADTYVFHAGTVKLGETTRTSGGRVLAVTAIADTLEDAVKKAYEGVSTIKFDGMQYRKDIAHRAFRQTENSTQPLTYAAAGVSIDAGNALVDQIKAVVRSTRRKGADAEIGGFGGAFDLEAAGYRQLPIILGAIDGVGTKLKIAQAIGKHDTVGIDLVAMNVNDLVVQGAEPLFFLDCFSCSKLDVHTAAAFITGVAEGCKQAGCALIGGETAEMPGMFNGDEYDAVGAAIGAVDRAGILPKTGDMKEGDILIGVASSGVHSNGFSLVRKIIEREGLTVNSPLPYDGSRLIGEELLTPTKIYVKALLPLVKDDLIKGMAHITGGGLVENVPRMLPPDLQGELDITSWTIPDVFVWLKKAGGLESSEFIRAFNCGLGMVLVVSQENKAKALDILGKTEKAWEIGKLVARGPGEDGCKVLNLSQV